MLDRILKRTINGSDYTITPLAAQAGALDNYRKLQKHMAPIVAHFMQALVKGQADPQTFSMEVMQVILLHLGTALGDPEFCAQVDKMFSVCAFRGGALQANHWDNHLGDHDELLAYCLWVNFILPFAEPKLRILGVDLRKAVGSLTLPPTSTGS